LKPTIVCAIEKATAEAVALTAGMLAPELGARIILAYVHTDPPLFNSPADRQRARNRIAHQGRELLERAQEVLPADVEVEQRIRLGASVEHLTAIVDEVDAPLIVVGSQRRGPLLSALFGSLWRALAREATCPVVVVPNRATPGLKRDVESPPNSPSTVVVGVDGAERSVRTTTLARQLADRLGDRLLLVHAAVTPGAMSVGAARLGDSLVSAPAALTGALERAGDRATWLVEHYAPPAYALQAVAAREHARLVVIGAPSGSGVRSLLPGSVAAQLIRLAPCPVVVLPERGRTVPADAATNQPAAKMHDCTHGAETTGRRSSLHTHRPRVEEKKP
jgi:nucleotide-binding universal stress UspA family protein